MYKPNRFWMRSQMEQFTILILTCRPASGKSENIDYLLHLVPVERLHRFRILPIMGANVEVRKPNPRLFSATILYISMIYLYHFV